MILQELLRLRKLSISMTILGQRYLDGNREKEMNGCWALDPNQLGRDFINF
jgi:hypothetical protein